MTAPASRHTTTPAWPQPPQSGSSRGGLSFLDANRLAPYAIPVTRTTAAKKDTTVKGMPTAAYHGPASPAIAYPSSGANPTSDQPRSPAANPATAPGANSTARYSATVKICAVVPGADGKVPT